MKEVICLDCSTVIQIEDDIYIGLEVICPACEGDFEVTHLSPIQIEWLFEDDDDFDYDDDDVYDEEYDDDYDDDYEEEFDEEEEEMQTY
jgi:hypothetical protein